MPEKFDQDEALLSNGNPQACPQPVAKSLRLWPAVFIGLAYLVVAYGFKLFGSTNVLSFVGLAIVPVAAALLLIIWWLAASRAPVIDRIIGFVSLIAALAGVVFSQKSNGVMLLAYALPAMTTGLVVLLVATCRIRWPMRRLVLMAFMMACAGIFAAMRVDTIGGNLAPIVAVPSQPHSVTAAPQNPGRQVPNAGIILDQQNPFAAARQYGRAEGPQAVGIFPAGASTRPDLARTR